jgi:hypothetical protein
VLFRSLGETNPPPRIVIMWLALPMASVALTALLPLFAVRMWRSGWGTRAERISYSAFAIVAVAFAAFLNYWKLVGLRY